MTERVVLIHSAVADSTIWARQIRLLEDRYEVVAPDLPGFGTEPIPTEEFSFVDRIAALLPAGAVVGNSFGGRIALETALAHPEGVSKLLLVAAAIRDHEWSDGMRRYSDAEDGLLERGDIDGAVELTLKAWARPDLHARLRPMVKRSYELQLAHDEPPVRWPESRPLSELRAPTLAVFGGRDFPDFREIAERVAREAPNARAVEIPDAGHLPSLETPDEFEQLLLEFLDDGI